MNPRTTLILTVALIVVVFAGLYFFLRSPFGASSMSTGAPPSRAATSSAATSTAASHNANQILLVQPDYTTPVAYSSDITPTIRTELNQELVTVQAEIKANPLNMGAWTDLGTIHKQGGDYQNAALYWNYVVSVYQGAGAPYYSLGDLYENFLHDYPKAEVDYLAATKTDPQNVNAYASLYTMYHYTLKADAKAAAILTQGLAVNPGNNYLLSLQQQLKAGQ